jgi:hypothetical protein
MEEKIKRGRKKKFNDLVKVNFYIERELYEIYDEIVQVTNEIKGTDAITFSSVVRQILKSRGADLLIALRSQREKINTEKAIAMNLVLPKSDL